MPLFHQLPTMVACLRWLSEDYPLRSWRQNNPFETAALLWLASNVITLTGVLAWVAIPNFRASDLNDAVPIMLCGLPLTALAWLVPAWLAAPGAHAKALDDWRPGWHPVIFWLTILPIVGLWTGASAVFARGSTSRLQALVVIGALTFILGLSARGDRARRITGWGAITHLLVFLFPTLVMLRAWSVWFILSAWFFSLPPAILGFSVLARWTRKPSQEVGSTTSADA
jgi:hypothetical protein